jgi:RNA polymerase sigma-70 factor (ECF subfamily)
MTDLRRVEGVDAIPLAPSGRASARAAFESFFEAEYRRVLALALALCGRTAIAEELAQEAFISAYRRWDRIAEYDDPAAWVRRVVTNLATSSLRRRRTELRALTRLAGRREPDSQTETGDDVVFWRAVRELPARQAQCIALRYLEDRTTEEIATLLGVATATVRVHLHAGRSALALRLGERLDEEAL